MDGRAWNLATTGAFSDTESGGEQGLHVGELVLRLQFGGGKLIITRENLL